MQNGRPLVVIMWLLEKNGEIVAGGIPNTNIGANHNSKVDASKSSNKTGKKSWSEMSKEERKSAESVAFEKYGDMTIKDRELKQKIEEASNTFKEIKKSYNKTGEIPDELFDNFKKSFLCVEMGDYGRDGWKKMLNNKFGKEHNDVEMLNVLRKSNSAIDVENFFHTKL